MKKLSILFFVSAAIILISCSDVSVNRARIYMPDMAYSRAYETYSDHSNLAEQDINYNNMPVAGTVARGEEMPFPFAKDAAGDTTNYVASKQFKNPLAALNANRYGRSRKFVPY